VLLVTALPKPYVTTHPIGVLWSVVWIGTAVIELSGAGRRRAEATKRDRGSQIVIRVCAIPAVLLMIFSPKIAPGAEIHQALAAAIAGIAIFAAGEGLRMWAKATLGRYFTYSVQTSTDQPVITAGPYRFVRHPSYTGILLIAIGGGLVWGNWLGVAFITSGALAGLVYRINVEEKALSLDLGERYRAYAEHHKRLIPFVW
jgi:protein-S-isoprenylcysteine O-methyltransferase Ste14